MSSFARFDVLGSDLATLDAVFMLLHCACRRALDDTDTDALVVTEVDRCVQDQGKLMGDWGDIAEFGHLGK